MSWSVDGQTPEFLAVTRMVTLRDAVVKAILPHIGVKPGMSVLDVGSGSGEYVFRLGAHVRDVRFTGLEFDSAFVKFASDRARGAVGHPFEVPNSANEYRFVEGDGLHLPFADGAFDAVVSHTYLTAVRDWERALAEMQRVCKPGGIVSSISPLTDDFYGSGTFDLFNGPLNEGDAALLARVREALGRIAQPFDLTSGVPPREVPAAFARSGLEHVKCIPLGHYFCLSDADLAPEDYQRHVDLLAAEEEAQLRRLRNASASQVGLLSDDLDAFERLIARRRDELLAIQGHNAEWDWFGYSSLLACGRKRA